MSKLDKIAKKAGPMIADAAKKGAPVFVDATRKTAPVIADVAKKAGNAAIKAGSDVVTEHRERRVEKDMALIEEYKQKYPECEILLSKFDPDQKMGYKKTINWVCVFEIYDEYHTPLYRIIGNLESEFAQRRLNLYDNKGDVVGVSIEHGTLNPHVSIKRGSEHFVDVRHKNGFYYFSDSNYYCGGRRYTLRPALCCDGRVLMEHDKIKGYELLVIIDPSRKEECLLIYTAMKLATYSRPDYGGTYI